MASFAYDGIYNGVMLIGSNDKDFDLKTTDGISGTLNYNIELYTDGKDKQYCLRLAFDESKRFMMIPTYGTILIKTKKDEVIELKALYTYDETGGDKLGYSYFPISEEQLEKIINDGVVKFRIQVIAETDHHKTFGDREWKNDSLGAAIKGMVADVDKQWEKKKKKFTSTQGDMRADF
jgi:hypothetical protein